MKRSLAILLSGLPLALSGCGTYVPNIQENPFASPRERSAFIQAIVKNIRCEVQNAVIRLYDENREIDPYNRNLQWFDSWAAQLSLTLTIGEKGSLNPVGSWLPVSPPSSIFNLNVGGAFSTEAQRIDKIGSFLTVAELKNLKPCGLEDRGDGLFILQSDLKLYEWLRDAMVSIGNRNTPAPANEKGPFKSNVLSHQVKFVIATSGSLTPGWKLTTGTINQSGTFLSASRDRTQDLTITFGPPDPLWSEFVYDPATGKKVLDRVTGKPVTRARALAGPAASAAAASEISTDLSNAVRNALRP